MVLILSTVSLLNAKILTIFISNYHPQKPSCLSPLKVHKLLSWGDPNPPYLDRVQKACQRLHEDHILERPYHGGYRLTAVSLEVAKRLVNRQLGLTTNVEVPPGGDRALRIDFARLTLEWKKTPSISVSGHQLEALRLYQMKLGAKWSKGDRGRQLSTKHATFTITTGSNRSLRVVGRTVSFMVDLDNFFMNCGLPTQDRQEIYRSMEDFADANRISLEAPLEGPRIVFPKKLTISTNVGGKTLIETNINYSSGHPDLEVKGLEGPVKDLVQKIAAMQHYGRQEEIQGRFNLLASEENSKSKQSQPSYIW